MLIFDDYLIEKDDSIVGYCKLAKTIRDASAKRMGIRFIHIDSGLIQNAILHTEIRTNGAHSSMTIHCLPHWRHGEVCIYNINNTYLIDKVLELFSNNHIEVTRDTSIVASLDVGGFDNWNVSWNWR